MSRVLLDPYNQFLYQKTFDEVVQMPIFTNKEEKYIEQCMKYPVIFAEIPNNLKKKYGVPKNFIYINGSGLGMSKIEHDERIKRIVNIMDTISDDFEDLKQLDESRQNIRYRFGTLVSSNAKINLRVSEWVYDTIDDIASSLGLFKYELGLVAFFIGVQDASLLNSNLKKHVDSEVSYFWDKMNTRLDRLERGDL